MKNNVKKKKSFLLIMMIAVVSLVVYFAFFNTNWLAKPAFMLDDTFHSIQVGNDQEISPFSRGFIVTGKSPAYYDWSGIQMNPPYRQDDIREGNVVDNIIQATDNFILTDDSRIFKTSEIPFTLVYSNSEAKIKNIREFGEYLLVDVLNAENIAEFYLLKADSDFLLSFDGTASTVMLDADCHLGSKSLSLLSVGIDTHIPVTRVFHYTKMQQPHGILTLEDVMMYKTHRLEDHIILVGNDTILCYNINGEKAWEIDKPGNASYDAIKTDSQLLMYFPEKEIGGNTGTNAVVINRSGGYKLLSLPKYVGNLKAFKSIYIGIEYNDTIIRIDRNGKILSRYRLPEGIKEYFPSNSKENSYFVLTEDNLLKLYTTDLRKDDDD